MPEQLVEDAALMAVEVLSEIARDPAVPASVRVKASVAILERCGGYSSWTGSDFDAPDPACCRYT